MRHRFEDSCSMNVLNWNLYQEINSIRTWSLWRVDFLSEITSFLPLNFEQISSFQFKDFYVPFMNLQSIGFTFFAKIMKGSWVFCCSSSISFNPPSHVNIHFFAKTFLEKHHITISYIHSNFCNLPILREKKKRKMELISNKD